MGSLSDAAEILYLDHILKTTPMAQTSIYVGLSTADPLDDASGLAEPAGGAYARVLHNSWDTASSRATENTGTISFPEATGSWGTITHFGIFDSLSGGTMLAHGSLSASKTIGSGDNASFQDGAIDVSFNSGGQSTYLSNAMLDHMFQNTAYDTTSSLFVSLSKADPTDNASGMDEPVGNNYSRVTHDTWDAAAAGASENDGAITFPQASAAWGTVTHFAIFDDSSSGNMIIYGALDNSRNIGTNDTPSFADGALDVTID
jgi:hypothetical protein